MRGFKVFLEKAPAEIARKSYLYLHTSHPEKSGWAITDLIHEFGLGSKVLCTYKCRACSKFFSSHYRDAITICKHCGNHAAVMPGVSSGLEYSDLKSIYNVMDLYVQYAICEGFGLPVMEAASCGVPVAAINYSAMEDTMRWLKGYKIEPNLSREIETNADRSGANSDGLVEALLSASKMSELEYNRKRVETRNACIERYNWDKTIKALTDYFDKVERKGLEGNWDHPPIINPLPPMLNDPKISNQQYIEWLYAQFLQMPDELFGYKMLESLRSLNVGARFGGGNLAPCNRESLYNEMKNLAERRYAIDGVRAGKLQAPPQRFIIEAHNRKKK